MSTMREELKALKKSRLVDVACLYAETLQLLYAEAGIEIPEGFCPTDEARRITQAIMGNVEYSS